MLSHGFGEVSRMDKHDHEWINVTTLSNSCEKEECSVCGERRERAFDLGPTCKHCQGGGFPGESGDIEKDVCPYCSGKGYIDLSAGEKQPIICSYCEDTVEHTRASPFMGDGAASMCQPCWEDTRGNYLGSTGEDIGPYEKTDESDSSGCGESIFAGPWDK